jgi:DNA modification methylase
VQAKFTRSRDEATIWRAPSPKMIMAGSSEAKEDRPTKKPLTLFETPIRNHLKPGGGVYEPFSRVRDLPHRRRADRHALLRDGTTDTG